MNRVCWLSICGHPTQIFLRRYPPLENTLTEQASSTLYSRKPARWPLAVCLTAIILSALIALPATIVAAFPVDSAGSWNPNVPCSSPWIVRISDITDNMTGSSSYSNSLFSPGITENPYISGSQGAKRWLTPGATPSGWHSPGPSCTITNSKGQVVAAFVEINGVGRAFWNYQDCSASYDTVNGGTPTPSGHWCDSYGNLFDPALVPNYSTSCTSASDPTCWGRIHVEIDRDWLAAGYCGTGTACDNNTLVQQTTSASATTLIDVQGFVFWDRDHVNETWHSFSGWELHALTAWRIHQLQPPPPPPDFTISANPSSMSLSAGTSGSSTISLTSLNGFTGAATLTATVTGPITLDNPTTSLNPSSIILAAGGTGSSTLTVSTSLLTTPGTYTITVTASSGTLSHSTTVTVTLGLPLL